MRKFVQETTRGQLQYQKVGIVRSGLNYAIYYPALPAISGIIMASEILNPLSGVKVDEKAELTKKGAYIRS